jgi:hypothetical protein
MELLVYELTPNPLKGASKCTSEQSPLQGLGVSSAKS